LFEIVLLSNFHLIKLGAKKAHLADRCWKNALGEILNNLLNGEWGVMQSKWKMADF
jgi:hypothetical protein